MLLTSDQKLARGRANGYRIATPTLSIWRLICDSKASLISGQFLDGSYKRVSGRDAAPDGKRNWLAELKEHVATKTLIEGETVKEIASRMS